MQTSPSQAPDATPSHLSLSMVAKSEIELSTAKMTGTSPLFTKASAGTLTRTEMAHYLANLRFLFSHGIGFLKRSAVTSRERGLSELADFYAEKVAEETGHEAWADEDLKNYRTAPFDEKEVTVATKYVVAYVNRLIDEDPRLFLAYMLFVEYFTVLAAPEFLTHVEERCGIRRNEVSAIANHAETDQDHVREDLLVVERLLSGQNMLEHFKTTLRDSAQVISELMASCIQ